MYIIDQAARSVQSDFDLRFPQKAFCVAISQERVNGTVLVSGAGNLLK